MRCKPEGTGHKYIKIYFSKVNKEGAFIGKMFPAINFRYNLEENYDEMLWHCFFVNKIRKDEYDMNF